MGNVPLTVDMIGPAIAWLITIIGSCFAIWRFFRNEVKEVEKEVSAIKKEFAEYRTHIAEIYVTRDGMEKQTAQIMGAFRDLRQVIDGTNARIDGTNSRIDAIFQNPPSSTPSRRSRGSQG